MRDPQGGSASSDAIEDDSGDPPTGLLGIKVGGRFVPHPRRDGTHEHLVGERDVDVGPDLAGGDAAADVTVHVRCSGCGWST